jgi:hypothetical protein
MSAILRMGKCLLVPGLLIAWWAGHTVVLSDAGAAPVSVAQTNAERDGQHDFDFEIGSWKIHLKRRLHPLTGSDTWVDFDGTVVARKIWDGRADFDEFEAESPTGHIEGVTLRLYNPQTRQWSLYWANSKDGSLSGPPQVGEFKDGRGEFFCQDTYNGRMILIRYAWSNITANSAHFEQAFSDDGGKTWEVNWITDQTRVNDEPGKASAASATGPVHADSAAVKATVAEQNGQHDFDPLMGGWKYHLKRRNNPLTGSTTWTDWEGTGVYYKVWDGRANLDTLEADGPTGHIEGLTLRLFNPETHQWSLYWANSKTGKIDPPQIGQFKNGCGEFYAQDMINGKSVFIRFDWTNVATGTPHFEQAFSDDGGKTWEVNWITDQTRVDNESAATR